MAPMTEGMTKALAVLPLLPVVLSVVGSSCILYAVLRKNRQQDVFRNNSYERLLVGMSVTDIIASIGLASQPFLASSSGHLISSWAFGNAMTCRIMGTVHQFGLASMFYYGMLSYYHLCVVRFGVSNVTFARRIEPIMHVVALGWPTATAVLGAVIDWYDVLEVYPGCWVDNYPKGCDPYNCRSPLIAWLVAGIWVLFFLVSVIVNNLVIFLYVRRIYRPKRSLYREQSEMSNFSGSVDQNDQERRIRMVATQGSLYVYAFFAIYSPYYVLQTVEAEADLRPFETQVYFLMVLQAVLTPLAGFLNALIFFRPSYLAIRSSRCGDDKMTRLEAMRQAVFGNASHQQYWRPRRPRMRRSRRRPGKKRQPRHGPDIVDIAINKGGSRDSASVAPEQCEQESDDNDVKSVELFSSDRMEMTELDLDMAELGLETVELDLEMADLDDDPNDAAGRN